MAMISIFMGLSSFAGRDCVVRPVRSGSRFLCASRLSLTISRRPSVENKTMNGKIDEQTLARERRHLLMFAMARLRDPDLAEDAVQETLVAALRAVDRFEQRSSLRTWLVSILINKMADLRTRQGREIPVEEIVKSASEDDDPWFDESGRWEPEAMPRVWSSPEKAVEQIEFWGVFERCLQVMSPRIAEVFVLREVLGESIEDICKNLGISASNCSVMLFRARASLRGCLQRNWFIGVE